jgi:hypothetical protein
VADIATLGLQVDSSGVDKGTKSLDGLTNAAKKAEAAAQGLSGATKNAGAAAASVATGANNAAAALNRESASATKAASALKLHAAAANMNTRGLGGASTNVANLAAQFQDIGVTAAMAMNPLQIALQQGTQIAAVLGPMGAAGAVRSLGEAFLSVISPVSLVTIAIVALVAAGLQMVDWPALAASALNGLASVLETIAPYAAMAAAGIALIYAPAIIGGIISLIGVLAQLSVAAITLAASFAAANPAVAFVLGITAAVAAANIFRDELTQIFGVDIVGVAATAINQIIGAFVGGFQGIKAAWSALPAALGDIVYATANAVITGVQNMINRVSETINGYIASINSAMKSLPFGLGESISIGTIGPVNLGGIENPYAGAADAAQSAIGGAISDAMNFDYVGNLGAVITEGASAASEKLKEVAAGLTNVEAAAGKAGGAGKKAGEDTAAGFDTAKTAMKQAEEAMGFAKDVTKGFISDLKSGLKNGEGFWKSFANAATNALDKIANKLLDQALDGLFGGGAAGGGGILGGLFGGIFGGGQFNAAKAGNLLPGLYADGTASARAGMAIVGEEGPEVVRFRGGEKVIPNHQLQAANSNRNIGGSGGGGGIADVRVYVDQDGNWQAKVESIAQGTADRTSKTNLAAYSKNQERAGFGRDQKTYNARKG